MEEKEILNLGYQLKESYEHDEYHTNSYKKGPLLVDFTYEGARLEALTMCIEEVPDFKITQNMKNLITASFALIETVKKTEK